MRKRTRWIGAAALVVAMLAGACGGSDDSDAADSASATSSSVAGGGSSGASDVTLTLYNAQHESLIKEMVAGFTEETGIKVEMRNGKDFELGNQLVQEGSRSPADLFVTENSPAIQMVADKGLLAPVDGATLGQVPDQFSPPHGNWVGMAARSTVFVYNPSVLPPDQLPASIMDLSKPEWNGKVGIAATGADFQAIVSAVVALEGVDEGRAWLKGLKSNAKVYQGNGAVMKAVNAGEIPAGVIYHYYWFKDRAESGANSSNTELHFFENQDPGAFVSVSGAGALASSKHPAEAQVFLKYLTGPHGQQVLADSTALEYTVGSGVPANPKLKPFDELQPPDVDESKLNGPQVIELMQEVGFI